jgi:hypothetical protein
MLSSNGKQKTPVLQVAMSYNQKELIQKEKWAVFTFVLLNFLYKSFQGWLAGVSNMWPLPHGRNKQWANNSTWRHFEIEGPLINIEPMKNSGNENI